jgi:hypothetical protein
MTTRYCVFAYQMQRFAMFRPVSTPLASNLRQFSKMENHSIRSGSRAETGDRSQRKSVFTTMRTRMFRAASNLSGLSVIGVRYFHGVAVTSECGYRDGPGPGEWTKNPTSREIAACGADAERARGCMENVSDLGAESMGVWARGQVDSTEAERKRLLNARSCASHFLIPHVSYYGQL